MGKMKQLYNLRANISIEAQKAEVLLDHIAWKSESLTEIETLGSIALEKSRKISRMSEKIGKIFNH